MSGFLITVLRRLKPHTRDAQVAVLVTAAFVLLTVPQAFADLPSAGLDHGFRRLYDLDFTGGQKEFESWEKLHPENPMGPASEAAGILFSEFNRLGVLEAPPFEPASSPESRP